MALTIDELNIQIEAESTKATTAIDTLIGRLDSLKSKLGVLGDAGKKASDGIKKTGDSAKTAEKGLKGFVIQLANGQKPMQSFTDKLARQISKYRTLIGAFKSAAGVMANWYNESNEYIETLNLFNVTMGDGADAAYKYAESVQSLIGIDIKDWMQYQGVFKNLTAGFGVASEDANVMSKNLTQLSYDMASFFNTDVETAFDKLSSAMSGQVKGLREFGIDTTVASLQEYALSKGIDTSVRSMTQAEKSMLRYNYIMEKSIDMQGDMARTLVTPANALRVLEAQLTRMKRAFGNIISVLVTQFIPYIQAMVEIVTEAATALANFFGFELPDIDYSNLGSGFSDAEEDAEGVSDTVKKIKKQLMGFDELNIISNPDEDGGSGAGGSGGLNMDPLEYDFLKGLDTSKMEEIKSKMKAIFEYIPLIATGLATWKLTSFITDLLFANTKVTTLKQAITLLGKKLTLTAGVTLAITGIILETKGIVSTIQEGLNGVNFTEILGGGGTLVAGAALIGKFFGGALIGGAIGAIIAGAGMLFAGLWDAIKNGLDWLSGILIPAGTTMMGTGIGLLIGSAAGPWGALIGLAVGLITDLVILLVQNWETVTAWCSQACTAIGQFFVDLWNGIVSVWNTVADWFDTWVIQPIVGFFTGMWEGISNAASACWNSIVDFFSPAVQWFSELFSSIWQTISDIFYNIGVIASGCWEIIKVVWGIVKDWFNEKVIEPVSTLFINLWEGIKNAARTAWEGIKNILTPVFTWINEKIIQPVSKFFAGLWEGFKEGAKRAWEGIKSVFSTVATFFKNIFTNAWNGIVKVFSIAGEIFVDIKDGIVSAFKWVVNGIIKGINKVVSIPFGGINSALEFLKNLEIVGIQPFKNLRSINVPEIPLLAQGGIVDAGQMFVAREAGPELVGTIGKKTAVANNDQIVSGIESGVYRAMVAANANSNRGGTQTIRIINEIDGDVVGEKVIKYHNGKVIQTGVSPLLV